MLTAQEKMQQRQAADDAEGMRLHEVAPASSGGRANEPMDEPLVIEVVEQGGSVRVRVHLDSVDAAAVVVSRGGKRLAIYEAR